MSDEYDAIESSIAADMAMEDLEAEVTGLRRMLWLVVEAAGAKVSVPRSLQEEFNPAARLHFGTDPDTGSLDFWTEKAP